jgi:tetratricopeptide (TPR) repeat protein
MKRRRIFLIPGRKIILFIASALLLFGCSLPRIIILHDPLTTEEHDNLGRSYESEGKFDLASDQYQEALTKDPKHVPSLLLLGDLSYRMKDFAKAESAYTKALKFDPKNTDARNDLAWVYIQTMTKLDKAKDLTTEAIALNPGRRPYYLDTLGVVLLKLGNEKEAITALKESADTLPKDRPELLAEALGHLGDAYKAAGDEINYRETLQRQRELQK